MGNNLTCASAPFLHRAAEQEDFAFEGAQAEGFSELVDGRWVIKRLATLMLRGVDRGIVGLMGGLRASCIHLLAEPGKLRDEVGLVGLGPGDRCGRAALLCGDLAVHIVTMGPRNFGGFVVQST